MAAAPAGAQTVGTLVSNVDEGGIGSPRNYAAQSFRTGGQAGGYEITEIRIFGARSANPPTEPLLKIRDDDGGEPGDLVATLSNPSHFNTDEAIFRAPSGTMLDANTTYWVMINDGVTGMRINYSLTSGNGQTGQPGWSIGDTHLRRLSEVNEWATDDSDSVRVHIRGPVTAAPIESGADATLRDLRVRTFTDFYSLRPAFDPGTTSYLVSVPENVGTLYVAPTPSDSGASVRVSPGSRFNSELWAVSVSNGSNTVNVIVTAVDGTEKRYRLNLRARNPRLTHDARLPPDSRLRFLALSADAEVVELPGEEVEGEDCGCATYYQVVVPKDVSRLQVAAMAQGGARVETKFRRERRRRTDAVRTVSLREGRNEMIVFVYRTGNNPGRALEVYRVMIIRAGSPPKLKDATVTREGHVLLRYDRTLLPDVPGQRSTPGSAFEVIVDRFRVGVTHTAVTEKWLHLNLARTAGPDAQVRVRYRIPSSNPVRSGKYGLAAEFSNKVARYAGSGFLVFDTAANEAPGATADFKVMLLPAPVTRVSVDYETSDDTATAGADYTATSGTLIFEVGETHKRISVPVIDDDFEDGGETFTLTLSNPVNAFLGDAIATGTITNDDPVLLTASFGGEPETHGGNPFDLELEFTEPVGVGWEALRDEVLSVTNGRVTGASRVDKTRDPLTNQWLTAFWQITVEPSGGDVTVEVPATADCGAPLAVCTSDGRPLSERATVTVAEGVLPPDLLAATVNADAVVLTWDEALDEASVPDASAFTVRVGGVARALAASDPVKVSGSTVTLTLASPVGHGETVTVDYTAPATSPLRSVAGGAAAALDGQPVTNRTPDTTGPVLLAAAASWDAVVLTWDEALDEASVPAASAFTVRVGGAAWGLAASDPVTVSGSTVTLRFGPPVAQGETVTVDYAPPSVDPLQDLAGVAAAAATVETVVPERAFTVRFEDGGVPETHDGVDRVAFRIEFSEELAKVEGRWVREAVRKALVMRLGDERIYPSEIEKLDETSRRRWQIKVRFMGAFVDRATRDLTIELGPTRDCADEGALCTGDGRKLSNRISTRVRYVPSLSAAGGQATEAADATIDFTVTLSRAASKKVTVDYATSDETATGGADYTASSGTLTFAPGETEHTVTVTVLDDADAEGPETLTLALSNASGASLKDESATGTIWDDEPPADGDPLTAELRDLPASHDGSTAFTFELRFSEDVPGLNYRTLRDHAFTVTNGEVTRAGRLDPDGDEPNREWEITVEPDSDADISISLPATTDCQGTGAICVGNRPLSAGDSATVPGPATVANALTAEFRNLPASHDGSTAFTFELRFSEDWTAGLSHETLRDHAFTVTNGAVTGAGRLESGRNQRWEITVEPAADADVTVELPATTDCGAAGAICIGTRPLSAGDSATVAGPAPVGSARTTGLSQETLRDHAFAVTNGAGRGPRVGQEPALGDHDGSTAFTFELRFSEDWTAGLSHETLRDHAFTVTNGAVTGAGRLESGRNQRWEITVEPAGDADVTVELPATTDCGAAGAICIGTRPLSAGDSATVAGPAPLTAEFRRFSVTAHDGSTAFTFELRFSEDVTGLSYRTLRDHAFAVTNGAVTGAGRLESGRNQRWEITVEPAGDADVTVELPATTDCGAAGAICIGTRPLSAGDSATVAGRLRLSVADATVTEAAGASVDFAVRLDRPAAAAVTVDYATSNGTATAGADYTSTSGTLTFTAGEVSKTIAVPVLEDSVDEGSETFTMTLSNPSGGNAYLFDAEATGTIENHDPLPRALMARFGRAAAAHVVEQVEERLAAPREPGFDGRFAGRELRPGMERDLALEFLSQLSGGGDVNSGAADVRGPMARPAGAAAALGMPGAADGVAGPVAAGEPGGGLHDLLDMGLGGGDVLTGSAFALSRETRGGVVSFWSRGARSSFAGEEGDLGLDGEVRTTMFGADYARGPLVVGMSLANSRGLGEYVGVDVGQGASSVTGLYPWLGYRATERVTVWGVAGYGKGALLLTPGVGGALESGLSMKMAATGMRGELIAAGAGGFDLAFKADALWVGTAIEGVKGPSGRLAATAAAVSRLRTGLEGSRDFTFAGRLSLTPRVEVGLRHDGGDAETGAGMDVGGGLAVSDPSTGVAADVRVRRLVAHQAEGFREWGLAASLSYDPAPSTPLGFVARVAPSWGGEATGGAEALWGRETMAGLTQGSFASGDRLDAEVGYGLPMGSQLVGTSQFAVGTSGHGRDYRLGYSLGLPGGEGMAFKLGVHAHRREVPLAGGADNGFVVRATLGW